MTIQDIKLFLRFRSCISSAIGFLGQTHPKTTPWAHRGDQFSSSAIPCVIFGAGETKRTGQDRLRKRITSAPENFITEEV